MSELMRAVNEMMRADWAGGEHREALTRRNQWVWDAHHVSGVPGRQIPALLEEELRRRELGPEDVGRMSIAYATVRKIIEGPRP